MKLLAALVLGIAFASAASAESLALPLPCTGCPPGSALGNLVAFAAVSAIALRWRRS